jgi:spoIIIJ-associated protein
LLEPMNPFERRIVHLALKDEINIETESLGEGIIKKIKVNYIKSN